MKIDFENLGVLKSGSLSLKPLMIFCGPNNTGKTYAMYMLYGFLSTLRLPVNFHSPEINVIAKRLIADGECEFDATTLYEIYAEKICNTAANRFKKNLDMFFNAPSDYFSGTEISVSLDKEIEEEDKIRNAKFIRRSGLSSLRTSTNRRTIRVTKLQNSVTLKFSTTVVPQEIGNGENTQIRSTPEGAEIKMVESFIRRQLVRLFFYPYSPDVFLLPAERSGINIFQKELVAKRTALFHPSSAVRDGLDEDIDKLIARYPKPIADYIDFLNDKDLFQGHKSEFSDLAVILEDEILGGRYVVEDGDVTFVPTDKVGAISLHLTSSTVKTYFGLWFYLSHMAAKGDVLMVDEPELSLHPDNQRKVARVLAKLVNKGVKIVLSTHSDYILKEFNNLIMLNTDFQGRNQLLEEFNYGIDELLSPDIVAAYAFGDSQMALMEMDPDEGIIATTFDQVINTLNESSNRIFYTRRDAVFTNE